MMNSLTQNDQLVVTIDMVKKQRELLERARNLRIKSETTIENLEAKVREDLETLRSLGINTENPEEDLKRLEEKVRELYEEIEKSIPYDILK